MCFLDMSNREELNALTIILCMIATHKVPTKEVHQSNLILQLEQ